VSQGVLYISYDGMLEPLGQSQVLAYLERLAPGRRIHLMSFEKSGDWRNSSLREAVRRRIENADIRWHPLRYHKAPSAPATAYDIAVGSALAAALCARQRLTLVHARSYMPGVMALTAKRTTGARLLFDMRGLWADERVDGDLWSAGGRLYRAAKAIERRLLLAADQVVTLTNASEQEIRRFPFLAGRIPPLTVIPTCADLQRFTIQGAAQREPFVLGYIGSVGTWYLLDQMLRCFVLVRARKPGARLLIANRGEHERIMASAKSVGICPDEVELVAAGHDEVPALIGRMSAAMALIKPAYSKIASAPTKLAEYLGCGVPCLGNAGVGDVEQVLEQHRVGVAVREFSEEALSSAVDRLIGLPDDPELQQRCRATALDLYSLDRGVAAYDEIYRAMAGAPCQRTAA
jgi:glycosyltransferase involved in cell wall biosynthesis